MKHILIRSGKSPFYVAPPEEVIHRDLIGTNAGNLLFSDAMHKILLADRTTVTSNGISTDWSAKRAAQINEAYDAFVVPLANAFRPSYEASLNRLSKLIEQLTIPVVVVGVGAQTGVDYDTGRLKAMEPAVRRFMKAVLKRSASIGVRGELTADYLKQLGFTDVDVIGCPSMFLHGDTFPALDKKPQGLTDDSRVAINLSFAASKVGPLAAITQRAYERFPDLTYFAQNTPDAELLFWGDTSIAANASPTLPLERAHGLLRENKMRVPLDPYTWMRDLSGFDFSFGSRIHGNIAALLSGTPAMVLCHDSRTLELCRYFDIPHQKLKDLPADTEPAELYEKADFSALHNGHKERFDRFIAFMDRNGLENTFSHGDGGAVFEKEMAALELPPSIEVWDGGDDGALGYRVARLREQIAQTGQKHKDAEGRARRLEAKNKELEGRVRELEKHLNGSPLKRVTGAKKGLMVRLGPAIRRRLRRTSSKS
ncbi:hypothetical protein N566_04615 [Streptomycetaceae bacterium MP113-05]|nr:hypothetical protein N566_04615 [Streptomycetaceae bacterium MP113-05]